MEPVFGFSRAVVSGRNVHVAGTAPIPKEGIRPTAPTTRCASASRSSARRWNGLDRFQDVVRTRMFLVHAEDWPEVARAHGEVFADIRPASTAVVVKALLDTRWRVEVEADAVLPE